MSSRKTRPVRRNSPGPKKADIQVPGTHDWRTTDRDEVNKRRLRAQQEDFQIRNLEPAHPIFSNFQVKSGSGLRYTVEIRSLGHRRFSCDCVDFRINGLGTCKHVEAVLLLLEARHPRLFQAAVKNGSPRPEVVLDRERATLRLEGCSKTLPRPLQKWFDQDRRLRSGAPERAVAALARLQERSCPGLRISQEVGPWLISRRRAAERRALRREYEAKVQSGEWPVQETLVPLFPYQREGMLHLAFTERALLADEMGLGKTIQAIAACALLHRLGKAQRVLVVTPASLKTEWEEQIQRFTALPYQVVFGQRHTRLEAYANPPFFTIVNYEQMLRDALEVNERLHPDIVILDEAQRIKNWSALTTQAVKRLRSRYAFVLTGTPIENRIDELHSLMDFLDPTVLGPLFRFNRDFYQLDERGRPQAYRNLDLLHQRVAPHMIRRRKHDVESELPDRTERTHFVPLSPEQKVAYQSHEQIVATLANRAKKRPLTQAEQEKLMRHLQMMRMVCDTNYILDPNDTICPKLAELEKILEECRDNPDTKVIIFSEWERMLSLIRDLCKTLDLGHAWHTGSVPQKRRRAEINLFKNDPDCRVFLSTDSGSTGLNLQAASVVINCDLPWNPAKLEQRIARAWRKHQTRAVTVIHLVSENTIEHGMLQTLSQKAALSEGVLDRVGDLDKITLRSGRQAFLKRLDQVLVATPTRIRPPRPEDKPVDRPLAFARQAHDLMRHALIRCEERYPQDGPHSVLVVVVDREAGVWRERLAPLHQELFGPGQSDPLTPTQLQVIDQATDQALAQLIESGLLAKTSRATRPLLPEETASLPPAPLTPEERESAESHRAQARRRLKMACLLEEGGFTAEARAPLCEALLWTARALAVEHRWPEPRQLTEAVQGSLASAWKDHLSTLLLFLRDDSAPARPVCRALQSFLEPPL